MTADVEGDIEEVDGVLKITRIRLLFHLRAGADSGKEDFKDKVDRALSRFADGCPAYQSVKGCIDVSWDVKIEPGE